MRRGSLAVFRVIRRLGAVVFVGAVVGGLAPLPSHPGATVRFARVSDDPVVHGQRLAHVLGCSGCHGAALTGEDWSEAGFARIWTSNLTRAVPHYSDTQLDAAIRGGVRHDGAPLWDMPSHLFTRISDRDMSALIAYLRSRPPLGPARPLPIFDAAARTEIAAGIYRSSAAEVARIDDRLPVDLGPEFALGRHIVRATCAECHGADLRGGTPHPGAAARPDLRIAAGYDAGQFERLMTTGIAIGDRDLGLMSQVARGRYRHLTAGERAAVLAYLQALAKATP